MKLFTDSETCQSKVHCKTCRDREGGRAFRASLPGGGFALPLGVVDFDCPHGQPWDAGVSAEPKANDVDAVRPICQACEHFDGLQKNGLYVDCTVAGCGGCGVGEISLTYGSCPKRKWPPPGE